MKYDIAIIGTGLGALASGAVLAKRGKKILLVEQHSIPGGCATTFKRGAFKMEVGLHEIDGLYQQDSKVALFKNLGVFDNVKFLRATEFYKVQSSDKKIEFTLKDDVLTAQKELCEMFPAEKKGIKKFFSTIVKIRMEINKIAKYAKYKKFLFAFFPIMLPNMSKNITQTLGNFLDKHIKNEKLKIILAANTAYYHDNPRELSMVWFASAQASYLIGGGYFIKGGSQNLSDYLAKVIKENGGEFVYNSKVCEIIIDEKTRKASGIKAKNKQGETAEYYSEKVIANCAISSLYDMLPEKESAILREKYDKFKSACSLLSVYIGFSKPLDEVGVKAYSTIILDENLKTLEGFAANVRSGYKTCPMVFVDYGKVDASMAPEGKTFASICLTDYIENWENLSEEEYKNKKKEVAEILLERLEKEFPGIKDLVEIYEVGTPRTIKRYTGNKSGTVYGFAQIPGQMFFQRPIHKTPVGNLYISSAYSVPGGGFTGTILCGAMCAGAIIKEFKE
ncbi:MAG: NAD(P)/FAD-dependent oxidoreductase [Chitinivibrionia bacterium]|nr:NAD(P)/FAD-dependent oxidoreductase [Chitinivibrionia bacterium]